MLVNKYQLWEAADIVSIAFAIALWLVDRLTYRVDPFASIIYDVQRSILPHYFSQKFVLQVIYMTQVRNTQNQKGTKPIVIEEKTTTIS
jgi:hypothetical protein